MGKNVLLISSNQETCPSPVYPLALPRLAAAVEARGHRAAQFDVLAHGVDALAETIGRTGPDLIGLSIRNIDNVNCEDTQSYVESHLKIVRAIRRCTKSPIILGGSGFSLLPEQLMSLLGAELGVVGPGEEALAAVLAGQSDPADVPGLVTQQARSPLRRPGGGWSAACRHDSSILGYYWKHSGMIGLQTKRGCPRACSYCTYPLVEGRAVQWADPSEIVEELRKLASAGVRYVFFTDSVYNLDAQREAALAEEMCRQGLGLSWGAYFAPCGMTKEYLSILKQSGLTHLEFGADSLSDAMLDSYRKPFSVEDVVRTSGLCDSLQLHHAHFLLFGGPGETVQTATESIRNAGRLGSAVFFPLLGIRVFPGTPLCETYLSENPQAPAPSLQPAFYFSQRVDRAKLRELIAQAGGTAGNWVLPAGHKQFEPAMRRARQRGAVGPLWECFKEPTQRQDLCHRI